MKNNRKADITGWNVEYLAFEKANLLSPMLIPGCY